MTSTFEDSSTFFPITRDTITRLSSHSPPALSKPNSLRSFSPHSPNCEESSLLLPLRIDTVTSKTDTFEESSQVFSITKDTITRLSSQSPPAPSNPNYTKSYSTHSPHLSTSPDSAYLEPAEVYHTSSVQLRKSRGLYPDIVPSNSISSRSTPSGSSSIGSCRFISPIRTPPPTGYFNDQRQTPVTDYKPSIGTDANINIFDPSSTTCLSPSGTAASQSPPPRGIRTPPGFSKTNNSGLNNFASALNWNTLASRTINQTPFISQQFVPPVLNNVQLLCQPQIPAYPYILPVPPMYSLLSNYASSPLMTNLLSSVSSNGCGMAQMPHSFPATGNSSNATPSQFPTIGNSSNATPSQFPATGNSSNATTSHFPATGHSSNATPSHFPAKGNLNIATPSEFPATGNSTNISPSAESENKKTVSENKSTESEYKSTESENKSTKSENKSTESDIKSTESDLSSFSIKTGNVKCSEKADHCMSKLDRDRKPMSKSAKKRLRKSKSKAEVQNSSTPSVSSAYDTVDDSLPLENEITSHDEENEVFAAVDSIENTSKNDEKKKPYLSKNEAEENSELIQSKLKISCKRLPRSSPIPNLRRPNKSLAELSVSPILDLTENEVLIEKYYKLGVNDDESENLHGKIQLHTSINNLGTSKLLPDSANSDSSQSEKKSVKSSNSKKNKTLNDCDKTVGAEKKAESNAGDLESEQAVSIATNSSQTEKKTEKIRKSKKTKIVDDCKTTEKADMVSDDKSLVSVRETSSASGLQGSTHLKQKLMKDWKMLDIISSQIVAEAATGKGTSKQSNNNNNSNDMETNCDIMDKIISSLGVNKIYDKAGEVSDFKSKEAYVLQKVIEKKTIHVFEHNKQPSVCTDELIKNFTQFTQRNSVKKTLNCKQIAPPFFDILKKNECHLFKRLGRYKLEGVSKQGELPDKLSILPLESVPHLLKSICAAPSIVNSFEALSKELNESL